MNARPADTPEPVLLVIADISGYTRYMTANAKTLAHSHALITDLIHALVHEIELPLEVAKLEGDAIFLFCRKQISGVDWPAARRVVAARLLEFFRRFADKLAELGGANTCTCSACAHIGQLRLKVVVHSGEALFHRVLNFAELAGVDVIIVHRLLKNSVNAAQYLLLTEAAQRDLEFAGEIKFAESAETYKDIGRVNALIHLPAGEEPAPTVARPSFGERFQKSRSLFLKLWFAPFAKSDGQFRNVESAASRVGKILFAALTAVLTPIFVPVGILFALLHARKNLHAPGCHDHRADGSCCAR